MPHLKITDLTALTAPASDDLLVIEDTSAAESKHITVEDFLEVINVLTAEATVDGAADYLVMYDTSAGSVRRVLPDNLPGSANGLQADGTVAGTGLQELLGLNLTDATELTIAAGVVTVTQGYHTIDTEADAATDDLDTITVAGGEGDILILHAADSARTVVIKHGTGNVQCAEGYDLSLDSADEIVVLIHNGTNWLAMSLARRMPPYLDNGDTLGGEVAGDVYYHDGTTVTNLRIGTAGQHLEVTGGLPAWEDDDASSGSGNAGTVLARVVSASNIASAGGTGTAWDISTGSYAAKSMSVSSQDTVFSGLAFSSDGTKAYVIGYTNSTVYQYTLSTAWDISTGSYATKSMSVNSEETTPYALAFSSDGTKAYVIGRANETVYQYTLSTAWDISTGSYAAKSMSVSSQEANPTGLAFSSDGTKAYVIGTTNDTVYQYSLSTASTDPSPIDGITLADGNRVLLAGQTDPIDNGVYDAVAATDPGTWTRISNLATSADASGRMVAVAVGTINSTSLWVCESPAGSAVVETNDLTFTKYS